jgi:hypothetical protein
MLEVATPHTRIAPMTATLHRSSRTHASRRVRRVMAAVQMRVRTFGGRTTLGPSGPASRDDAWLETPVLRDDPFARDR